MYSNSTNPLGGDFPPELQKRFDRLKITWGWSALLIGPICIGVAIYCFVEARTGPWAAWWEENYVYQPSQCVILEHKLSFLETSHGRASRPELLVEYQWDGVQYKIWTYRRDTLLGDAWIRPQPSDEDSPEVTPEQARAKAANVLNRYPISSTQLCWVNPNDPSKAILRKWHYGAMAFVALGFGFFLLVSGILSLWYLFGKLLDRRCLLKRYEADPENWNHGRIYPHRLEIDEESRGQRLGQAWGIMLWTVGTLCATVGCWAVKNYFPLLVLVPFTLLGVGACAGACWKFLFRRTGSTEVEIDVQPAKAGQRTQVFVMQNRPLSVKQYRVAVRCRELTTFTEGTNTRTDSKEVFRQILHDDNISSFSGEPLQFELQFSLPEGFPASFKSEHNEIRWEITIEGLRRGRLELERAFPFEVQAS